MVLCLSISNRILTSQKAKWTDFWQHRVPANLFLGHCTNLWIVPKQWLIIHPVSNRKLITNNSTNYIETRSKSALCILSIGFDREIWPLESYNKRVEGPCWQACVRSRQYVITCGCKSDVWRNYWFMDTCVMIVLLYEICDPFIDHR